MSQVKVGSRKAGSLDGLGFLNHPEMRRCTAPRLRQLELGGFLTEYSGAGGVNAPERTMAMANLMHFVVGCHGLCGLDLSRTCLGSRMLRGMLDGTRPDGTQSSNLASSLTRLHLSGFTGLPASSFTLVLATCTRLEQIDFSASLVADGTFQDAAEHRPEHLAALRVVRLTECSSITSDGVEALCRAAGASLRHLALGGPFTTLGDEAGPSPIA